jgi:hypothetical protein
MRNGRRKWTAAEKLPAHLTAASLPWQPPVQQDRQRGEME